MVAVGVHTFSESLRWRGRIEVDVRLPWLPLVYTPLARVLALAWSRWSRCEVTIVAVGVHTFSESLGVGVVALESM